MKVEFDRRAVLALGGSALLPLPLGAALSRTSPATLWFDRPAAQWVEALPVGNGRLGAMVFGRVGQERLQLNENTLWAGSPYDPVNPGARAALPRVRALIDAGKFQDAAGLAQAHMMARPLKQMPYGTLGDIFLDFRRSGVPTRYRRELDLARASATTRFEQDGDTYSSEIFASAVDQVIVVRLTARGGGSLDFKVRHRGPREANYISPSYEGPATSAPPARVDWEQQEAVEPAKHPLSVVPDGPGAVLITGRNGTAQGIKGGLSYAMRLVAIGDGRIELEGEALSISDATNVTILIAAATSFVNFSDTSGDPIATVRRQTEAAAHRPYEAMRRDHEAAHRALFDRVSIDLGQTHRPPASIYARVLEGSRQDPELVALYFQYARYLMISSSRAGGQQPANLQGLWNEGTNPPWDSKYTININTEMNYWPADPTGLGECVEPLIRMVEDLSVTGARTADAMYGARGWMAHHNTDLWRATAPIDGVFWGLWPTGGAWLCKSLWDHYQYHPQPALLERLRPLLRGASLFFLDALVEDRGGRGLVTSPTISPENAHLPGISICAGAAMDRQIVRDLFEATIAAETLAGGSPELIAQLAAKRARIAPDRIGAQGQLQEWLEDWDARAPEQWHRHVSHLYAVYPSEQINVRDTPQLAEAARVSLRQRGDLATGWGTAWRACLWARLGDGDRAYRILQGLISAERTYPNLFDACPPFQIDGNFGGAAAIGEMLLQSWGGEVHVLPALPAAWPRGEVKGLRAKGGLIVDLAWAEGALSSLRLRGSPATLVKLRHRGRLRMVRLAADGSYATNRL